VILADALAASVFAQAKLAEENVQRLRDVSAEELSASPSPTPSAASRRATANGTTTSPCSPATTSPRTRAPASSTPPSHGDDDYQLGLKLGLPMTYNVLEDGSYRPDLPLFGGQHIITAEGKEAPPT
jgi:isoleucyl-tRNA synthetase